MTIEEIEDRINSQINLSSSFNNAKKPTRMLLSLDVYWKLKEEDKFKWKSFNNGHSLIVYRNMYIAIDGDAEPETIFVSTWKNSLEDKKVLGKANTHKLWPGIDNTGRSEEGYSSEKVKLGYEEARRMTNQLKISDIDLEYLKY